MYKRILLAADGSENSLRAATEAVKLASLSTGAVMDILHARRCDLVVIGSCGLNALQEMVLGRVSHKVMKNVHCPFLVVK